MTNKIKVIEIKREFLNGNKTVVIEETCARCSGNGNFAHMKHVDNGICYKCEGTGVTPKTIKVSSNEEIELVNETVKIKPLVTKKVNDDEAMRNAMIRINEEKKAKRLEWERIREEDERLQREIEENFEPFTWD
ncbi:hypothetical protein ABNX05_11410 [Lysinibacillus sp. M3]|uniref:Uncharacterized protein n=1 Tax=Lysinibacillus zambalensis TaxID=3160866 RepID=A0ABV1MRT2_9BACI